MKNAEWKNWLNMLLGAWLIITPWALAGTTATDWNYWIVGIVVVVSASMALTDLKPWEEWTNMAFGVWLLLSPWIFGYHFDQVLLWNSILVGGAIALLSGAALPAARRMTHIHQ